jgi:hypothetical protein
MAAGMERFLALILEEIQWWRTRSKQRTEESSAQEHILAKSIPLCGVPRRRVKIALESAPHLKNGLQSAHPR